jgi:hypothetical protein
MSWADVATGFNVTVNGNLVTYGKAHFGGSVNVAKGGSAQFINWAVTIDGNFSVTDPATNSGNGFYGSYTDADQSSDQSAQHLNHVKGNVSFILDSAVTYPDYQWPQLDGVGGVTVDKNVTYNVGGNSGASYRPFNGGADGHQKGWNVLGHVSLS